MRFVVTGMGRSGTLWLARLLGRNAERVLVAHEAGGSVDKGRYWRVYKGEMDAGTWFDERDRYLERRKSGLELGDVNSYLRYAVPEVRVRYGCPVAGLVRDGRYVVRSLLGLGCYQHPGYPEIPASVADAFEACCWYWADVYRRLQADGVPVWRLEHINDDYGAFADLASFLSIAVAEDAWQIYAGVRQNVSVADEAPPQWDRSQIETFAKMAGDVQAGYGYPTT